MERTQVVATLGAELAVDEINAAGGIKSLGSINPGSVYGAPGAADKVQKSFADQLQQELENLQSDLKKAEEKVRRDIGL